MQIKYPYVALLDIHDNIDNRLCGGNDYLYLF